MKLKPNVWRIIFLLPLLSGCYPEGPDYTEDLDLVYSNYAPDFDFTANKTYAIPDSVIKITGDALTDPDGDHKPKFVSEVYAKAIVAKIKQNMSENGWDLVDKNNSPDVVMLPSAMTTTTIYYDYDWAYWEWWYPGWDNSWGWYYPGYYPPTVSGYTTGSIFIQMIASKNISPGDNVPIVWNAILNGLAQGNTNTTRIEVGIDKAFSQSPYLKH